MLSYVKLLSERVIIPISIITVQEKKVILEKIQNLTSLKKNINQKKKDIVSELYFLI